MVLVLALLAMRGLLLAVGLLVIRLLAPALGADPSSARVLLNVVIVGVDVLTIALVVGLLRREGRSLGDLMGRFRFGRDIPMAGLAMLALFVAFMVGSYVGNLLVYGGAPPIPEGSMRVPMWLGLWTLVVMAVTVAVAEELLYRGWAQEALQARWRGGIAVLVASIFFGLQHLPLTGSWEEAVPRFLATFLAGLALGFMRLRGTTLWALVIAHWLFDVIGLGLPAMRATTQTLG